MIDHLCEVRYSFQHPANLSETDIEVLLAIEQDAFPIDFYNREQLLEEYQGDPWLFIVTRDKNNNPVGYVSGSIRDKIGDIVSIAVEKSLRGQGIGSCLTGLMIDYLRVRGAQRFEAHTRVDNMVSIRLFSKFGFVVVDRIEDYYRDRSPALRLIMQRI